MGGVQRRHASYRILCFGPGGPRWISGIGVSDTPWVHVKIRAAQLESFLGPFGVFLTPWQFWGGPRNCQGAFRGPRAPEFDPTTARIARRAVYREAGDPRKWTRGGWILSGTKVSTPPSPSWGPSGRPFGGPGGPRIVFLLYGSPSWCHLVAGQILRSQPDPSPNVPRDQIRRKDPCCDLEYMLGEFKRQLRGIQRKVAL